MQSYPFARPLAVLAVAAALVAPGVGAAAVLYDNGPLVSHPGAAAGGVDASVLQTALGVSTLGFGHQLSAGSRVADDFTVPAGGWNISTITFFAYQTDSTTTSTITAVNLRIWDGPPDQPGSTVVFGDTTTNRLTSSVFSNVYRVTDSALTDARRPIMANVLAVNTALPAGTYWLDWQTAGSLASGPWAPPVTIAGQGGKAGANALQSVLGWAPAADSGVPQDFPFVIESADVPNISVNPLSLSGTQAVGTTSSQTLSIGNSGTAALNWSLAEEPAPGTCSAPADVPWLSASPASGTTAIGGSSAVTVSLDATGLAAGTYSANLCVSSNDPDPGPGDGSNLVVVPVQLTVTAAPVPVQPVPTLGEFSLGLLGLALAGLGFGGLRRRQG